MGIAIVAYRDIKKTDIPVARDETGYVKELEGHINLDRKVSDDFEEVHEDVYGTHPGYFDGLDENVYYEVGEPIIPISVAYSTYSTFRDILEEYATEEVGDETLFREMIKFSDCEGTFGSVVCKKLLTDFKTHHDGFAAYADETLLDDDEGWFSNKFAKVLYDGYIKALEAAVDNGVMLYE